MAEFHDRREDLAKARGLEADAEKELAVARDNLERLKRERQKRLRTEAETPSLDEEIAQAEAAAGAARAKLNDAQRAALEDRDRFARFNDPRKQSGQLSDEIPILLLPLRLETRFKSAQETKSGSDELWVRVYPDDIFIDSFEDSLSQSEAADVRSYWAEMWSAAHDRSREKAAWRALVRGQASGRSFWISNRYRPANEAERPLVAGGVPTVIFAIPAVPPLSAAEKPPVAAYWEAVWRAADDQAALLAAETALITALGGARAAEIREDYRPRNLSEVPTEGTTRAATTIVVTFLEFPTDASVPVREKSWSQVPRARALPDRLVLLAYQGGAIGLQALGEPIPNSLAVGPVPDADPADQLRPDGTDLKTGSEIEWLVDFDHAVGVGMGFRLKLTPEQFETGFDQLLVLGLRLAADETAGKAELEQLIRHHHQARSGLSILPQGRPTNNVEGDSAGYSWVEDPDVSFDHYFPDSAAPAAPAEEWFTRSDGKWLSDLLGLDAAALADLPFFGRSDVSDARAMNVALWPATLGYFMDAMLDPVFDEGTIEQSRDFFNRHVLARGQLPAIRVGKQPYGILPATPRSRMRWLFDEHRLPRGEAAFLQRIYGLLQKLEDDLKPLAGRPSFVGKSGDAQQILLDIVGLHSGSVEFRQRYAESLEQLFNRLRMDGAGGAFVAAIIALGFAESGKTLMSELGYADRDHPPDILDKLFLGTPNPLNGPLIDDAPLSETAAIRAYTADGSNYIQWLIKAAQTSHDALRLQDGFQELPAALLYWMLHHALDLSFVETSIRLVLDAGLIGASEVAARKREPRFLNVREGALADESAERSRWHYLYSEAPEVTGDPSRKIGEFIPTVLTTHFATAYLKEQLKALDWLKLRPTAVLERTFAEHLDLCSYRFDAWYGGLLSYQLERLRYDNRAEDELGVQSGIHLGAYAWLEEVRPEQKTFTKVELDSKLAALFDPKGDKPPLRDSTNQGFIHAPSLNQAVTAAVLRNGYLSNATPENPTSLAVNLSSERVREALSLIEGVRADQSLGALLGYRFERGLHDRHDVEIDSFIFDLRKAFPLVADRLEPTASDATDEFGEPVDIAKLEARNVIDGLALVEQIRSSRVSTYPFGLDPVSLPAASTDQARALSEEAGRILELADALADVAMAESVHQVVQGNYDRAGAVLDTYSKGKFPSVPEVVQTPRSGAALTHRVALHLKSGISPADPSLTSPRAKAEPALNAFLSDLLPPANEVACSYKFTDPITHSVTTGIVRQPDLDLLPIDLFYLFDPDSEQSAVALDDLVETEAIKKSLPKADAVLEVDYRSRIASIPGHVPFFELAALLRPLRGLLLRARPLRATDMALAQEATKGGDSNESIDPQRLLAAQKVLTDALVPLETFATGLKTLLDADAKAQIIAELDDDVAKLSALLAPLAPFARTEVGTAALWGERRSIAGELRAKLKLTAARFDDRLDAFDAAIDAYNAAPVASDVTKFEALAKAERLISTSPTDPLPAVPDDYRDSLLAAKRPAFESRRDAIAALRQNASTLKDLHAACAGVNAANAAFDSEQVDIERETKRIIALAETMRRRSAALGQALSDKLLAVKSKLDEHDAAATAAAKTSALTAAAKLLFDEEFQMVPEFTMSPAAAGEWSAAWGSGPTADTKLLDHLTGTLGIRFPVEDWMTGAARVREKVHDFETASHLAEAFKTSLPPLQPLQFPYRPDVPWIALDFPLTKPDGSEFTIDEDKLLYTGCFAAAVDPAKRQAGLLLDEWTEVIPSKTEETGIVFHYDRPNCEPPQTMLLALPSAFSGGWSWADLVDTVRETMDLAKKRAIEPDHIDATVYSRLLPALISSTTLYPLTAGLNLAFNNKLADVLEAGATP